jgi:hypothetical protein
MTGSKSERELVAAIVVFSYRFGDADLRDFFQNNVTK